MPAMNPAQRDSVLASMAGRDLLTLSELTPEEMAALISLGIDMKEERKKGHQRGTLAGKSVAVLFFKPSTRTRLSFEVAIVELGAHPLILHGDHLQLGRGESVEDTARVMSRYVHGIVIRTYAQEEIELFARYASVPVINALTDQYHPVQIAGDLMTLTERFGRLDALSLAYVGDGNNVTHSLMIGGCMMGMDVRVATPETDGPDPDVVDLARKLAAAHGGQLTLTADPQEAVQGAHAIYTDTWVSMGQDDEREGKLARLAPYQVNAALLSQAAADGVVMHCLPAHIEEEITAEVAYGPRSVIFDQAENRLHIQKALLHVLLG